MEGFGFAIFLKEYFRFLDGGSSCRRDNGDYSFRPIRPQEIRHAPGGSADAAAAGTESLKAIADVLPSIAGKREFRGKLRPQAVYTHLAGPCYVFIRKPISSGANPAEREPIKGG